ncbi:hypothetical protein [Candidatus Njordibacter sp. Uisw_058]|jgi:hypothetical protein|uniref:hypothetical protein n=1 Tax=Candidatus Njordibacter sp. Uisw_058 TaxID=3230974 RepID=UPI003D51E4E7
MDINSTFDMSRISGINGTNSLNSEKAQQVSFLGSLGEVSKSDESPHEKAIKAFYEVHQRSQITGVPTNEYNQVIAALGLGEGQSFAATDMLNKAGYHTGMPSVEAILRYGNTSDTVSGNLNFLKGGNDVLAQRAKVGIAPNGLDTKKIPLTTTLTGMPQATDILAQRAKVGIAPPNSLDNKKIPLATTLTGMPQATTSEASTPTRNFYDAAVAMSAQLNSTQLKQPIDQVAEQVNSTDYQAIEKQLAKSYIDNLQMKQSIESLDTLLG